METEIITIQRSHVVNIDLRKHNTKIASTMTLGTWSFCYCSKIIMFSIVPFSIQDPIQIYFLCISILVHEYDFTCRCAGPFVQNCWAFFVDFPYVYRTLHYTYSDFLFISTK